MNTTLQLVSRTFRKLHELHWAALLLSRAGKGNVIEAEACVFFRIGAR